MGLKKRKIKIFRFPIYISIVLQVHTKYTLYYTGFLIFHKNRR